MSDDSRDAPTRPSVYVVEVALLRSDDTRAHDATWVVATSPADAESLALASAGRRWPGHTPLEVTSIRVDHSRRAGRFLRRSLERTTIAGESRAPPPGDADAAASDRLDESSEWFDRAS